MRRALTVLTACASVLAIAGTLWALRWLGVWEVVVQVQWVTVTVAAVLAAVLAPWYFELERLTAAAQPALAWTEIARTLVSVLGSVAFFGAVAWAVATRQGWVR